MLLRFVRPSPERRPERRLLGEGGLRPPHSGTPLRVRWRLVRRFRVRMNRAVAWYWPWPILRHRSGTSSGAVMGLSFRFPLDVTPWLGTAKNKGRENQTSSIIGQNASLTEDCRGFRPLDLSGYPAWDRRVPALRSVGRVPRRSECHRSAPEIPRQAPRPAPAVSLPSVTFGGTFAIPFGGGVIGSTTGSGPVSGGSSPPPRANFASFA